MPRWDNQLRRLEDTCTIVGLIARKIEPYVVGIYSIMNCSFCGFQCHTHISARPTVGLLSQDSQLSSHIRKKTPLQQTLFTRTQTHMECTWLQCMFWCYRQVEGQKICSLKNSGNNSIAHNRYWSGWFLLLIKEEALIKKWSNIRSWSFMTTVCVPPKRELTIKCYLLSFYRKHYAYEERHYTKSLMGQVSSAWNQPSLNQAAISMALIILMTKIIPSWRIRYMRRRMEKLLLPKRWALGTVRK